MRTLPVASLALAALTLVTSMVVAALVTGRPIATTPIVELATWGGVRWSNVTDFELWRIATAQLVHVKGLHMLYNVVSLALAGALVERVAGPVRVLVVWLVAGGAATLLSPILIEPPFNVGTGASQAVLSLAGCAGVFVLRGALPGLWPKVILALCLAPAFALDFIFAGYPKPGHLAGLAFGAAFGWWFSRALSAQDRGVA